MVMDLPCQDQLIRLIFLNHLRQLTLYAFGAANRRDPQRLIDGLPHLNADLGINITDRTRQLARSAGAQTHERLLHGCAQVSALFIGIGSEYIRREHEMRFFTHTGRMV